MRKTVALTLTVLMFCLPAAPAIAKSFGDGVCLEKSIPVCELLENGDDYVGQRVQFRGMIVEICASRGRWLYVAVRSHSKKFASNQR